jgi:hypothetical protein
MPTKGRLTRSLRQLELGRFDFRKDAPAAFKE